MNSIPKSCPACLICDPSIDFSGGRPPRLDASRDRAVELPVMRCRENQIAGLFRLDPEPVDGSTGYVRE